MAEKKSVFSIWKRKGYFWVTLGLFLVSITLHWIFSWYAYKNDQQAHHQPIQPSEYLVEVMRDTMENWQSEFLQLIWQVAGLSFLWYTGSPTSKSGDDRKEEKMDYLIRLLDPENGEKKLEELTIKYPKK